MRYEINDIWRCGFDINLTSDRYYLKRFPFLRKTDRLLESKAMFEGFDGRNYTLIKASMFQGDCMNILPRILPVIERNFSTVLYNGTLDIETMFVNFDFNDSRSAQKISSNIFWSKNFLAPYGNMFDVKLLLSLKGMNVSEKEHSEYNSRIEATPQLCLAWKWPILMTADFAKTIFTPIIGVVVAGNKKRFDAFEDPFCEINDINFLDGSRTISPYNIDYGSRLCYGAKISTYKDGRNIFRLTIGRSRELTSVSEKLEATGLKYQNSNIVTSADVFITEPLSLFFNGSYSSKTNRFGKMESGLRLSTEKFNASAFIFDGKQCLYNPFSVTPMREDEKTQKYRGSMFDFEWKTSKTIKLKAGVIFGSEKNKLIKHSVGLEYENECARIDMTIERTNYRSGDVKPETAFRFVVSLKNLGL
jgi:LPS-assembly protein